MFPDSATYVMGARNILAGNGYTQFSGTEGLEHITDWPPLYSYVLSLIGLIGVDLVRAARLLNIALISLDLLLFAGFIFYGTRNKGMTLLACLLFLFSVPLFLRYTWALSEPLFFTLILVNAILYCRFLVTHQGGWVAALGFGTALLFLTRYVGIFMTMVWLPAILLLSTPKKRLINFVLFLAGMLPLVAAFLSQNYVRSRSLLGRGMDFSYIQESTGKLVVGLSTLEGWFTTSGEGLRSHGISLVIICMIGLALLAGMLASGLQLYKRQGRTGERPDRLAVLFPFILAMSFYVILPIFTIIFADHTLNLEDRIMSPLWFFGLFILMLMADAIGRKGRIYQIVVYAFLLVFLGFNIYKYQVVSTSLRSDGQGYLAEVWRTSPGIEYVKNTKHDLIYSDEPLAVYALTGRIAYQVPYTVISEKKTYEQNYRHYDFMRERLTEENGVMILFDIHCRDIDVEWYQVLTRDLHIIEAFGNTCVYAP